MQPGQIYHHHPIPPPRKKIHELIIAHVLLGTVVICKKSSEYLYFTAFIFMINDLSVFSGFWFVVSDHAFISMEFCVMFLMFYNL